MRGFALLAALILLAAGVRAQSPDAPPENPPESPPTLADFWDGRAEWVLEAFDVGLPIGESDTLVLSSPAPELPVLRSYLHASFQSAGIVDQCGEPVAFPGCLTYWESSDGGQTFALVSPVCALPCASCPCSDQRDHVGLDAGGVPRSAQQYPRVAVADDGMHYLAYEWHAQVILRRSPDGLVWSDWAYLTVPGGTWPPAYAPCSDVERIGPHPNIRGEADGCLVGAPPGIFVEGDTLYVFTAAGSAPGHMRCYKGDRHGDLGSLTRCDTDPLFEGAREYGPVDARGADANPYFDFRYVSSAEVVKVGERYYMAYEGIRGPDELERGMDTQFALGFARSLTDQIDGPWEKFPGNPVLGDVAFNWGVGHADLVILDGVTVLFTATSQETRGRYALRWIEQR